MEKFKLINEKLKKGVWINEYDLIRIINILEKRNYKLYKKLKDDYLYLIGEIE